MSPVQRPGPPDPVDRPRPGREPDGASFEAARVARRRTTQPFLVVGFAVVLGGVVALGLSGRDQGPSLEGPPLGAGTSIGFGESLAPASPRTTAPPAQAAPSPARAPVVTTDGPIAITARRHPETMFVHGDVFVPNITWVFVSLQDGAGRVAGWTSLSLPGAAGPAEGAGPTLRFDFELAVPAHLNAGPLWVQANVYDTSGSLVASTRLGMDVEGRPLPTEAAAGFRPGTFPVVAATGADAREREPVILDRPDLRGGRVTGRTIPVEGRLLMRAASLRVELRTGDGVILASAVVHTADPDGGIRPRTTPVLDVDLELPASRPVGWHWLVITAFDEIGTPIAELRRVLELTPRLGAD